VPRPRARRAEVAELARFAALAATDVGRWLAAERRRRGRVTARAKELGDPVTDLDLAGEQRLHRAIAERWPDHGFLGEETGARDAGRAHVWIVDPIDGTANFAAGLDPWGVSIACLRDGRPVAGALYLEPEAVTVVAARGAGARLGRRQLRMDPEGPALSPDSLLGAQWLRGARRLTFVTRLLETGTRVRVFGSTVVQLCDVARGRLAANVQEQGKVWDVAAAGLIVEEAGGRFTGWDGRPIFPRAVDDPAGHHPSVAAGPVAHRQILDLLPRAAVSRA
jgi:myo-inositol-1(or 4)-monophosphatase